jgi:hypothetical protein
LAIVLVVDQDEQDIIGLGALGRPTNDAIEAPIKAGISCARVANVPSSAPIPRHQDLRHAADGLAMMTGDIGR